MKYLLSLIMLFSLFAQGQNRNSIWCFGDSAGIDFNNLNNPLPTSTSIRSIGSCSSIADSTGNLLFYVGNKDIQGFDHGVVWNKNHQIMQNGEGLIISFWHYETLIIPNPGNPNLYYIFQNALSSPYPGIFYSIVDMSQDGGNGSVTLKNFQLFSLQAAEGSSAVKHANGRDWWVIFPRYDSNQPINEFYLYLITPLGILPPVILALGNTYITDICDINFSQDGSKMVFSTRTGLVEVMDFDRCNGNFSNTVVVEPEMPTSSVLFSNSISIDNNLIYVSSNDYTSYLFQYDLRVSPISSSKDTIATFLWPHNTIGTLRMAINKKIYLSNIYNNFIQYPYPYADSVYNTYNMNISVIDKPDSIGLACNFQPYSFFLGGKRAYFGLPNNPNYELGPIVGSICDSLIGIEEILEADDFIKVVPNPSCGKYTFKTCDKSGNMNKNYTLTLIDLSGRTLLIENPGVIENEFMLDLSSFSKGIYFVKVKSNDGNQTVKLILD